MHVLFIILVGAAGLCDLRTRKIPDIFSILITLLGILHLIAAPANIGDHVLGMFILSIPMLLLAVRFRGLGGGDIKLSAACGLFLGVRGVTLGFLLAGVLALLVMGTRSLCHRFSRKEPFPFGPFLAVGYVVGMLL
jgi:leader peptidase (prepilin peptidase)/N-methyltransferase